jgi:hypothetical protein
LFKDRSDTSKQKAGFRELDRVSSEGEKIRHRKKFEGMWNFRLNASRVPGRTIRLLQNSVGRNGGYVGSVAATTTCRTK